MNRQIVCQFFLLISILNTADAGVVFKQDNLTVKCNNRYGNLTVTGPTRPGFRGPIIFKTFQDFRNIFLLISFQFPSLNKEPYEYTINICALQSRRQNAIVRMYIDNLLASLKNHENLKCPLKKGIFEIGERSVQDFHEEVEKYVPSFVRMKNKGVAMFTVLFKDRNERIDICQTKQDWSFELD